MITLVGAFAGLRYLGMLGVLVGPLAIAWFFELLRLYREDYVEPCGIEQVPAGQQIVTPSALR